ncbi:MULTISPECIES: adenylate/guanylate cyclase domain-containing protein [Bradyrhizobium]|uniref:adenylate/guanylate cyclase domain-containing protein n=1 Tax=Bradyrhizobium TaxID=374 RepID=UPI0012BCD12A|nr:MULTISPECIES: adenylate/guanylate cyclase domain-containing protein [Bradyrhizobium]MCS3448528.1 class 3 adenylate cyclase [Bradyrhizobium elkanii]MCS3560330.1 class 3 adenylate cyclase [Bradyrhizobium elkanii]MCW2149825.1 class 3 adenylate cyclase [Bradyrhizobium elkanii]MCW2360205.1 class 3 adenylate cyclase [Bradyrhizobium elkanii]MCW2373554.1 class 3 adenylate cyclase [Bradyrhizobium elkanii]
MTSKRVERQLAAVLAADVAGYNRLMSVDELGILEGLKTVRGQVVDPAIARHNGRTVKTTSDGMLVEFAVDDITCAMAIQDEMEVRNKGSHRGITFRIGINIGDVIIDGVTYSAMASTSHRHLH